MNEKNDLEELSEEIADETYKFIQEKIGNISDVIRETRELQTNVIQNLKRFDTRLTALEEKIRKHLSDFETTAVEVEKVVTERHDKLSSENDELVMRSMNNVQDLRDEITRIKAELNRIREQISQP